MMTPEAHFTGPVRVSIVERLVPSLAFAVAAISGAVGSAMLLRFLAILREEVNVGYATFFGDILKVEFAVAGLLAFAFVLCAVGVIVSFARLFTTNTTASPPGLLFLMTGVISLVPPFALHYLLHMMKEVVQTPGTGGVSSLVGTIDAVTYFAIGAGGIIALAMLAFSFIPFTSRPGRKSSPLVCLILVEILIAFLAGVYFWEASLSVAGRDEHLVERYSEPTEPPSSTSEPVEIPGVPGDMLSDVNDASSASNTYANSRGRTVSGGVLNGKAVDLPQPSYPPAARAVRASGAVNVQVTIDEKGEVISANAVSGHPLLRAAGVQAARKSKFKPTLISGQAVKVTGVIVYNFVP